MACEAQRQHAGTLETTAEGALQLPKQQVTASGSPRNIEIGEKS